MKLRIALAIIIFLLFIAGLIYLCEGGTPNVNN